MVSVIFPKMSGIKMLSIQCAKSVLLNKVCVTVQKMRVVWPLGAGLQEQASNRLKLRWLRARVVSV
jgi:hypothetical protein